MQKKLYLSCGGNILDKYEVKLTPKAFRDLDDIYWYISHELSVPETALNMISEIENAILGLEVSFSFFKIKYIRSHFRY